MFERLEELEEKYEELTRQMADPDVVTNRGRYLKLVDERNSLTDLVETYRHYKRSKHELEDARELLDGEADEEMVAYLKKEIHRLEKETDDLEAELKFLLLPKDPYADRDIIMEIRAGTGGNEAALFAGDLFRMYSKYGERLGWKLEVLSSSPADVGGFKEVILSLRGKGVYPRMKFESGVHRVQRVPVTESSGRIHTSAATVAVLPEAEEVEVELSSADLKIDVFRSTGPGGQSVNTTDSAVRVTHLPSGIVVSCQDEKSQLQNKEKALRILRARLLEEKMARQKDEEAAERRSQVGTGDRSEKIRTYNFPQSRVTDHRIGLTLHRLDSILEGDLDKMIEALMEEGKIRALENLEEVGGA